MAEIKRFKLRASKVDYYSYDYAVDDLASSCPSTRHRVPSLVSDVAIHRWEGPKTATKVHFELRTGGRENNSK